MAFLNDNYLKLQAGYLFPEIARRVREFCDANPDAAKRLIRCGIGDVTEPLPPAVIAAMHHAVDELSVRETFRGYGHEQGLESLREKIAQQDYRDRGLEIAPDEIFISEGSKSDCGYILDVLGERNRIAISDPVYPAYVDTNVMAGHTGRADDSGRLRRHHLSAVPTGEPVRAGAAERTGRRHLSLLSEQPDWRRGVAGAIGEMG